MSRQAPAGAPAGAVHPGTEHMLSLMPFPIVGKAQKSLKGEDMHVVQRALIGDEEVMFVVVADGHGGTVASKACQENVVKFILKESKGDATSDSLRSAAHGAFAQLHDQVRGGGTNDGSTLTVVMLNSARGGELTTASVGDSSAILVPQQVRGHVSAKPTNLTAIHRIQDSVSEQKRVVRHGGRVGRLQHPVTHEPAGPLRAFPGGVACARAIGDADVGALISAKPATSHVPLKLHGHAGYDIVVASDGVWDAISPATVVRALRNNPKAGAQSMAELLVEQAVAARHAFNNSGFKVPRDDTTCIVLRSAAHDPSHDDEHSFGRSSPRSSTGGGGGSCFVARCDPQCGLAVDPIELDESYVHDEEVSQQDGLTTQEPLKVLDVS